MKKKKIRGTVTWFRKLIVYVYLEKEVEKKKIAKPSENHTIIDKPVND